MHYEPRCPRTHPAGTARLSYRAPLPDIHKEFPASYEDRLPASWLKFPCMPDYHFQIWKHFLAGHDFQETDCSMLFQQALLPDNPLGK